MKKKYTEEEAIAREVEAFLKHSMTEMEGKIIEEMIENAPEGETFVEVPIEERCPYGQFVILDK